jgi:hypothetical protein
MLHSEESNFRQFAAEYLREFETEFESILGCLPGAEGQLIYEEKKNQKSKISWDGLFKYFVLCLARGAAESVETLAQLRNTRDTLNTILTENEQLRIQVLVLF